MLGSLANCMSRRCANDVRRPPPLSLGIFPVGAAGNATKMLNRGMQARRPSPGMQRALRANTQIPATGAAVTVGEGSRSCSCE